MALTIAMLPSSFPLYAFAISVLGYCFGRLVLSWASSGSQKSRLRFRALSKAAVEDANTVSSKNSASEEQFQLEKRAFFSKTWLFVCHQSKFEKPGDYHAFSFAGIQFFIVLGQDLKLRAFHNVCRHRAYTVVRKSCGTSKLFSCKYHGWQYDEKGSLVKAPKFDLSPGFKLEENGLFEVKLLRTQEGLVRVNFDASTLSHPFQDMTSSLGMGNSTWVDGFDKEMNLNWKAIAKEFASQAQWCQSTTNWLPKLHQPKVVHMLGPMAMLREMGDNVWCTMKALPESAQSTKIRCDFYARAGHPINPGMADKYKVNIEKEITSLQLQQNGVAESADFSYEVGGRVVELAAILAQHQRSEVLAQKKLQPRIRLGQDPDDLEAEALCSALDSRTVVKGVPGAHCTSKKVSIEW